MEKYREKQRRKTLQDTDILVFERRVKKMTEFTKNLKDKKKLNKLNNELENDIENEIENEIEIEVKQFRLTNKKLFKKSDLKKFIFHTSTR